MAASSTSSDLKSMVDSGFTGFPKHDFVNGVFVNPWGNHGIFDALRMMVSTRYRNLALPNGAQSISTIPSVPLNHQLISSTEHPHFSWLGHASCYYQTDGVYFLTDPIFSERASLSQYVGPKRLNIPPASVSDLKVDVVLLSHTHYDHMDAGTIQQLGNTPLWYNL